MLKRRSYLLRMLSFSVSAAVMFFLFDMGREKFIPSAWCGSVEIDVFPYFVGVFTIVFLFYAAEDVPVRQIFWPVVRIAATLLVGCVLAVLAAGATLGCTDVAEWPDAARSAVELTIMLTIVLGAVILHVRVIDPKPWTRHDRINEQS